MKRQELVPRPVMIVYRRLSQEGLKEIRGVLRERGASRLIIESRLNLKTPIKIGGQIVAKNGYLAIWFVYKARWYDVGKFYDENRKLTGFYCDVVKPMRILMSGPFKTATITDLFLDVWITPKKEAFLLDEDELQQAVGRRNISKSLARLADREARRLIRMVGAGKFPPSEVQKVKPLETGRLGVSS